MAVTTINIIPLDLYLTENNMSASEVKYIWIDVEGFEPQVLLGMKNLLSENPAPIFMECNIGIWRKSDSFEKMMALLEEYYSHFVLWEGGRELLQPLEALRSLEARNTPLGRRGDIFLIKKGLVD